MRKITIGFVTVFTLIPHICLAASNAPVKKEAGTPCFNGGFSFGLAGYSEPIEKNKSTQQDNAGNIESQQV